MKNLKKTYNIVLVVAVILLVVFIGLVSAWKEKVLNDSYNSAIDEANRQTDEYNRDNNLGVGNIPDDPTDKGNSDTPTIYTSFDQIYSKWQTVMTRSESLEMITYGNIDCKISGTLAGVHVNIGNEKVKFDMIERKAKSGDSLLMLKYTGNEIMGYKTNACNKYYYDSNTNMYTIYEEDSTPFTMTKNNYLTNYGVVVGNKMMWDATRNVDENISFEKTETGYTAITKLNTRCTTNYVKYLKKLNSMADNFDFTEITVTWRFNDYGVLLGYDVCEKYSITVNAGPAKGIIDCVNNHTTIVNNINGNVSI